MAITYAIRTKEQHIEALREENKYLKQQVRDLLLLNDPGFFIDLKGTVNIIHQKVILISRATSSFFFLYNRTREKYELAINKGLDEELLQEVTDYIENDPDNYLLDEVQHFYIPSGFLLLPLSRRHKEIGIIGLKLSKRAPENIIDLLPLLTQSAGITMDNALMYEKMLQKLLALSNVFILGKEIISTLDINDLIKKFLSLCCEAVGVDLAALYLFNKKTHTLEPPVILDKEHKEYEVNNISGVCTKIISEVLTKREFVLIENLDLEEYADEPFHFKGIRQVSTLCFPVIVHDELIAIVQFSNKKGKVTHDDIDLLKILINQMAYVLQNSRYYVDLHQAYLETAEAFANAIDKNFKTRENHVSNVATLSMILATELGLNLEDTRKLKLSAYLHDIGKLGVPNEILNQERELNPEEKKIVEKHVFLGTEYIENVDYLQPIGKIILNHHERWDGQGYPNGTSGEDIPYLSRILTIVDAFEAMTSDRPHRKAMPLKKAYDELANEAGKQFDPELTAIFLKMIEEGKVEI
ncbi:GAF and HD-GYP domain-containing protein [Candidatus Riflebacteria bacterium]